MTETDTDVFCDEFICNAQQEIKSHDDPVYIEPDMASLPESSRNTAQERLEYIKWLSKRVMGGWTEKNLRPLLDDLPHFSSGRQPSCRTLAEWYHAYRKSGGNIMALVPKHKRKGNRKNKAPPGLDKEYQEGLESYLVDERVSIRSAYEKYHDRVIDNHQNKIKPMSYDGFRKRLQTLPQYEVMVSRYGKRMADLRYNQILALKRPSRVFEQVEIDHTPLDLILLDDELDIPLGRPTLTLLVDRYSHCIAGYHIGFQGAGYDAVRQAIFHAMSPKEPLSEQYPDTVNSWPCSGKIESIFVDNGAEFWSKSLELACNESGIHIQFNPVAKPWLKPFVERMFGSINTQLLISIPGKTFSNILQKEGYDPKKDAVMRFSTFICLFHKWVVDVYNVSPDSRLMYIPTLLWQEGVQKIPPGKLTESDLARLRVTLGMSDFRCLRKGGIHIHNLTYDSKALSDYRKRFPPEDKYKALVKTDPSNISKVAVFLEKENRYLDVPCIDPEGYTKGLSLTQHRINRKLHQNYISGQVDIVGLAKARLYLHERIQQEIEVISSNKRKSKVAGGKKLAEYQGVSSAEPGSVSNAGISKGKHQTTLSKKGSISPEDWSELITDLTRIFHTNLNKNG